MSSTGRKSVGCRADIVAGPSAHWRAGIVERTDMFGDRETDQVDGPYRPVRTIDAMPLDGLDPSAEWRVHMREQTMARQTVERRYARSASARGEVGPAQNGEGRSRAAALRAELARIDAEHWAWLREHGADVPDRLRHKIKAPPAQQ